MVGDLLRGTNSIRYFINRAEGGELINAYGATTVRNSAVAENNSPEPRDRVSFRYNYFNNAQSVTGIGNDRVYRGDLGLGVFTEGTQTANYDTNLYTLSFEKTFAEGLFSVEARLSASNGLSPTLNLRPGDAPVLNPAQLMIPSNPYGQPAGLYLGYYNPSNNTIRSVPSGTSPPAGYTSRLQAFTVNGDPTASPAKTLGSTGNQFSNSNVILKGLIYKDDTFLLSGGLGVEIPTGPDTRYQTTDYLGGPTTAYAEIQRVRNFVITNETWALSPFLAALATPTENFFAQGFLQVECPLNGSRYTYSDTFPMNGTRTPQSLMYTPQTQSGRINDQYLLHVDIGAGYWLLRNPEARWFNGIAPTAELHYITALDSAELIQLPGDNSPMRNGSTAPGPLIGNTNNRVDILDLTLGTTLLVANRATIAAAAVIPLKRNGDRTFDYEVQLQINYYFGRPSRLSSFAPNF